MQIVQDKHINTLCTYVILNIGVCTVHDKLKFILSMNTRHRH